MNTSGTRHVKLIQKHIKGQKANDSNIDTMPLLKKTRRFVM